MNRSDLVRTVHENVARSGKARLSKAEVDAVVWDLFETIIDALANSNSVRIAGFGAFEPRQRAARAARDPRNGREVAVPATIVPVFRPGKKFKRLVADVD